METLKTDIRGLPWWLSGKEPACQCRRHGSIAVPDDSTCTTTAEPVLYSLGTTTPKPTHRNQRVDPARLNQRKACSGNEDKYGHQSINQSKEKILMFLGFALQNSFGATKSASPRGLLETLSPRRPSAFGQYSLCFFSWRG